MLHIILQFQKAILIIEEFDKMKTQGNLSKFLAICVR